MILFYKIKEQRYINNRVICYDYRNRRRIFEKVVIYQSARLHCMHWCICVWNTTHLYYFVQLETLEQIQKNGNMEWTVTRKKHILFIWFLVFQLFIFNKNISYFQTSIGYEKIMFYKRWLLICLSKVAMKTIKNCCIKNIDVLFSCLH